LGGLAGSAGGCIAKDRRPADQAAAQQPEVEPASPGRLLFMIKHGGLSFVVGERLIKPSDWKIFES
jgi:hypothetical protein